MPACGQRRGDDARAEKLAGGGDDVERARRHLAQHAERAHERGELVELRGDLCAERTVRRVRRERARRRQVPFAQLLETRKRLVDAASAGRRRNGEQRVGDAAHRRHDDRGSAAIARPRRTDDLNQASDRVGVGDGRAAEFLDNHKQQILYGKAGVGRVRRRRLALVLVVVLPDGPIVASRIRDDFVMASIELVHLVAFSIERGNRLLVFVPVLVLVRKGLCRSLIVPPALIWVLRGNCKGDASQRNFYFPVVSELGYSRRRASSSVDGRLNG